MHSWSDGSAGCCCWRVRCSRPRRPGPIAEQPFWTDLLENTRRLSSRRTGQSWFALASLLLFRQFSLPFQFIQPVHRLIKDLANCVQRLADRVSSSLEESLRILGNCSGRWKFQWDGRLFTCMGGGGGRGRLGLSNGYGWRSWETVRVLVSICR